jgi:hypothetical protein
MEGRWTMTLNEIRAKSEKGGIVKLEVIHNKELTFAIGNYKTVYVVLDFNGEYYLHHYFPAKDGWTVSRDIAGSSIERCLEAVTAAFKE